MAYIAQNYQKRISGQEISDRYDIPLEYLLKILQQLARVGILRSKRGPRGGFILARTIEDISFLQICEAIEGPAMLDLCISAHAAKDECAGKMEEVCRNSLRSAEKVLRDTRLADVLK